MYKIGVVISTQKWEELKARVLSKWYLGEPSLTHANKLSDESVTFSKFESEFKEDTEYVSGLVANYGGVVFKSY